MSVVLSSPSPLTSAAQNTKPLASFPKILSAIIIMSVSPMLPSPLASPLNITLAASELVAAVNDIIKESNIFLIYFDFFRGG